MKRRILMLFLLVFACVCAVLVMPTVSFFSAARFGEAQSRWQSSRPQSYEVVIQAALPLSEAAQYRSVVRDGQIVEIGQRVGFFLVDTASQNFSAESFEAISLDDGSRYTLEGLMSFAQETAGSAPTVELRSCGGPYWDAEYDTQYGYVQSLRMSCGGGFLGCAISDCGGGYTVLSFTPIAP